MNWARLPTAITRTTAPGGQQQRGIDRWKAGVARQQADEGDFAFDRDRLDRLAERHGDVDHVVGAAALGERAHALVPRGRRPVVDDLVGAERPQPLCLLVAAGRRDHARAERLGELQREQRDAARPQRQDGLARPQAAPARERVPCSDRGARQRRGLLEREMIGDQHDRVSSTRAYSVSIPSSEPPS
jgi:hypothetical protein